MLAPSEEAVEEVIVCERVLSVGNLGSIIVVATCTLPVVIDCRVCCTAPCIVSITYMHVQTFEVHTHTQTNSY